MEPKLQSLEPSWAPFLPSTNNSITNWIQQVQAGAVGEAQDEIVRRFLNRVTELARQKLGGLRVVEDESDVALSALKSFLMRAPQGGFPRLHDRDSLWSLLAAITVNKTTSLKRRHFAAKRDVRRNVRIEDEERIKPSVELVSSILDEGNQLLESLTDPSLRDVARLRMEGFSNAEIADQIDRSIKTVERRLNLIRKHLREVLTESSALHE